MKRTVFVSSPGKLIIAGEHAVVYGRRALVTSIDKRLYMRLIEEETSNDERLMTIDFVDKNAKHSIDLNKTPNDLPIDIQAVIFVYEEMKKNLVSSGRWSLEVRSEIPIGAGLGSSGAFSVCLAASFHRLCHGTLNLDEINQLAYRVECLFHGTPSGIDNTISTFGQSLIYSRQSQRRVDFQLKDLAIIDTGLPKSTKELVATVRRFTDENPSQAEEIFDEIQRVVDTLVERAEQIDEMFAKNQKFLVKLGVSIRQIDEIVEKLLENGISCKITGAGGGGCLIAHVHPSMENIFVECLKEKTVKSIYFVRAGVEGLREEKDFPKFDSF